MIKDKMKTWIEEQELQKKKKRELSGFYRSESESYGNWITNLKRLQILDVTEERMADMENTSAGNTQMKPQRPE